MQIRGREGRDAALMTQPLPPLGLASSTGLFGAGAFFLVLATRLVIPALVSATGAEPVVAWFVAASVCVFAPLLFLGAWLLHREGSLAKPGLWGGRLRFRPTGAHHWLWSLGGLAAVSLSSAGIVTLLGRLPGELSLHPWFMAVEPLTPGRYWILAVWLPFWGLNILAEEVVWRGVVLPRQEMAFGKWAWLVNGTGWLLFHAAFPWQVVVTLVPITLILPFVVQRLGNTWAGVIIHAGLNGPGFLALAFGLV